MEVKVIVDGSGGVGKSTLVIRFIHDHFLEDYDPTIEDSYRKQRLVGNQHVLFDVLDTAGQEEFSAWNWRHSQARNADVFFLLYSSTSRSSFDDVEGYAESIFRCLDTRAETLFEECRKYIVLVETKCDREDDRQIQTQEGVELARKLHAVAFFQTSAKCSPDGSQASFNVYPLFDFAAFCRLAKDSTGVESSRILESRLNRTPKALPWNWGKVYRWSKKLKKLKRLERVLSSDPLAAFSAGQGTQNAFRGPVLPKGDVELRIEGDFEGLEILESAVFADLYRLYLAADQAARERSATEITAPFDVSIYLEGQNAAEGKAEADAGGCIQGHAIVLAMRSAFFRQQLSGGRSSVLVPSSKGAITIDILSKCVRFCYNPRLDMRETPLDLIHIREANSVLDIEGLDQVCLKLIARATGDNADLKSSATSHLDAFDSSAAIQTVMAPALSAFKHLTDVTLRAWNDDEKGRVSGSSNKKKSRQIVEFNAHKAILVSRSEWFAALLAGQFSTKRSSNDDAVGVLTLDIDMMNAEVLRCVLEYLYTGRCEEIRASPNIALDVLETANALNLQRLITLCEDVLHALIDEENVAALCDAALFHNAKQLVAACEHFMAGKYDESVGAKANSEARRWFASLPDDLRERVRASRDSYVSAMKAREAQQAALEESMQSFRSHLWGPEGEAMGYSTLSLP